MIVENFLRGQGLNEKDIKIYLDIFRNGQSFASSVAVRTGIDRTTTYSALKRLLKQGVIVQTQSGDVRAYVAVSPDVFVDSVDRRIEDLRGQKKVAALFAAEMRKMKKAAFLEPKVKIYEGAESIINLYQRTLEEGSRQKSFLTIKSIPEELKEFLKKHFINAKKERGVFSKVLVADTSMAARYKALDSVSNRETKIVKNHPFDLHSEIILFGKKGVAIIDFHKQIYGIVIDSETFYKTVDTLFDFVWETA